MAFHLAAFFPGLPLPPSVSFEIIVLDMAQTAAGLIVTANVTDLVTGEDWLKRVLLSQE